MLEISCRVRNPVCLIDLHHLWYFAFLWYWTKNIKTIRKWFINIIPGYHEYPTFADF